MNYYRKIEKPINELKYKMQIAALILNINKNKNDIISLKDNISSNLEKINNISSNFKKEIFNENYIVEKQNFSFDKNTHFFNILEANIKNDFKIGDVIKINANVFYEYNNITNDFHRLEHEYNIYADNVLFFKKLLNIKNFILMMLLL